MTCVNRQVPAIYYRSSAMHPYMTIKYSIIKRNISIILTCAVYKMKLATFYCMVQYELRLKVYLKLPCIDSYLLPEREQDWNGLVLESS